MIRVKEVETVRELKEYVLFPFELYKKNRYWIPPLIKQELATLRRDRNPAFEYCEAKYWLVMRNNEIVGRIAGIINHKFIEKWKKKYARFGWIDFIDNEDVSRLLFDNVERWAKSKGLKAVHGPLGFTDMDPEGTLIEGFDELGTMPDIYNYSYYPVHIEKYGYVKDVDWVEYQYLVQEDIPQRIEKIANATLKRTKLKIVNAQHHRELRQFAKETFMVLNKAYQNIYGVVELSDNQIDAYIKEYFRYVLPDFCKVVLDKNGEVAGAILGMPSLSKALQKASGRLFPFGFIFLLKALKFYHCVDLYLIAVRPDLQRKGIGAILANEFTKSCIKKGIISIEVSKQLEDNRAVRALMKSYDTRQHKKRRCYIKYL